MKKVVILDSKDHDNIINELLRAKAILGSMRNGQKRNTTDYHIDRALSILTDENPVERRLSTLEGQIYQ